MCVGKIFMKRVTILVIPPLEKGDEGGFENREMEIWSGL